MSRYNQLSRYYGISENQDIIQEDLINLATSYTSTIVLPSEENSLELVSQRVYQNPNYWWVIARFNGILNPYNIPVGLNLYIPNIQGLQSNK